jgi:hypothetical protein
MGTAAIKGQPNIISTFRGYGATVKIQHGACSSLECSICSDLFKDPRILPCGHTFCLRCLQAQVKGSNIKRQIACAYCRTTVKIDNAGVTSFPKNYALEDCVISASESDDCKIPQRMCAQHTDTYVSIYCKQCEIFFCTLCLRQHSKHDCTDVEEANKICLSQISSFLHCLRNVGEEHNSRHGLISSKLYNIEANRVKLIQEVEKKIDNVTRNLQSQFGTLIINIVNCHKLAIETINALMESNTSELRNSLVDCQNSMLNVVKIRKHVQSLTTITEKLEFIKEGSAKVDGFTVLKNDVIQCVRNKYQPVHIDEWKQRMETWEQSTMAMMANILENALPHLSITQEPFSFTQ